MANSTIEKMTNEFMLWKWNWNFCCFKNCWEL